MKTLLGRIAAFFVVPATQSASAPASFHAPLPELRSEAAPADGAGHAGSVTAAVLGAAAAVVPVAAACAGELRARDRAGAALVCLWRPDAATLAPESDDHTPGSPAGATTPGARRLVTRLEAEGLAATARGRLAWLPLDPDPARAVEEIRRCRRLVATPLVIAVAGARPHEFEPLLADLDLAIAVLPADADPALRDLAPGTLTTTQHVIVTPIPAGPPRWTAMAGLARLRSLP